MTCVIDASVAMAWCFDDEATAAADRVLERVRRDGAVVPQLWPLEVTNVVVQAERRKRVSPADAARVLALVSVLPVQIDARTAALAFSEIVATARAHRLSTYDASYLELARRLALPLATLDRDLATAAKRDGVTLLL